MDVKHALESMRLDSKDTLNDVVERLIEDAHELDETSLGEIEAARAEIRAGNYFTQEQLRHVLGF